MKYENIKVPQYNLPMNSRPNRRVIVCGLSKSAKVALAEEEKKIAEFVDKIIAQEQN